MPRMGFHRAIDTDSVLSLARKLAAKTVIFDVEPLIAYWDTDTTQLQQGVDHILQQVSTVPATVAVCFATNSARRLPNPPSHPRLSVHYVAHAGKPLKTRHYRDLPRPAVIVGDQIATDGVLAWRLDYSFIHYCPRLPSPLGPRLMNHLGRLLKPLLFTR